MIALGKIWLWKQGVDAHALHQAACPLPVDLNVVITFQDLGDRAIAPGRLIRMDPFNETSNPQFFWVDELAFGRSVNTGPVDAQQFALALDGDLRIVLLDHVTGFACVVRSVFRDLFFSTSRLHRSTGQSCAPDPQRAVVLPPTVYQLRRVPF